MRIVDPGKRNVERRRKQRLANARFYSIVAANLGSKLVTRL
jgi:hypothetical protein